MAKEERNEEDCPDRWESGPHVWMPGMCGEPDWCYYCETERPKEEVAECCAVCGKDLPEDEPGVCSECVERSTRQTIQGED